MSGGKGAPVRRNIQRILALQRRHATTVTQADSQTRTESGRRSARQADSTCWSTAIPSTSPRFSLTRI